LSQERRPIHGKRLRWLALIVVLSFLMLAPPRLLDASGDPAGDGTVTIKIAREDLRIFQLISEVTQIIRTYHPKDVPSEVLVQGALSGVLEALGDPYSQYMTPDQFNAFGSSLEGEYGGIGISIDLMGGNIVVVTTFPNSPAEKAGIKPGDVLVEAEGQDLKGKTPADASKLIRGQPGTVVTITVERPSTGEILRFSITRDTVRPATLDLKDLGDGMFYIQITQFTSDAARQFPVIMSYLRSRGVRGIMLDLRNNPGGLLDSCISVAREMVPKGPIVELRGRAIRQVIENPNDTSPVPVAVLVNGGTASAAEILAGALRDRGVGILIGERTFGKASVQSVVSLGDDVGGMRLTIAEYFTPSGESLARTGLDPAVHAAPKDFHVPAGVKWNRPITIGMVGLDVLAIQEDLAFLGVDPGERDGVFGQRSAEALAKLCESRGIVGSGTVTKEIAEALNLAVTETAGHQKDIVLEQGKVLLERKIHTGYWQ